MESAYEFDSLSELPPLPQVYDPMEYSRSYPLESLPPFPHSDFTPYGGFTFSDTHQDFLHLLHQHVADSFFPDSSLSLLTRDFLTESTRFEKLLTHDVVPAQFLHLPDLRSVEHTTAVENKKPPSFLSLAPPLPAAAKHDANLKRRRVRSRVKSTFTISPSPSSQSKSPTPSSQSIYGADRRRKISDRIRSLEKLMPWEKKMSLATILEETHKYITFLQSQIASLRWMPLESVYVTKPGEQVRETKLLNSLTRQQILQVIANSPGSRNVLYTRGVCVFSYEQLLSVKMMAESTRNL